MSEYRCCSCCEPDLDLHCIALCEKLPRLVEGVHMRSWDEFFGVDGQITCEGCPHIMFSRCPNCQREMYAPAVWAFSHGLARCVCGHAPVPTGGSAEYHPPRHLKLKPPISSEPK